VKKLLAGCLVVVALVFLVAQSSDDWVPDIILTDPDGSWLDTRVYSDFEDANAAAGTTTDRTLHIIREESVDNDITIGENLTLHFLGAGKITQTSGTTTVNGSIRSGDKVILSNTGTGSFDFDDGMVLRTSWFDDFADAVDVTTDDTVILVVSDVESVTASDSLGDYVALEIEGPGNYLSVANGVVLSNVKDVRAGRHLCFLGPGRVDFGDGSEVRSSWFERFDEAVRYVDNSSIRLVVDKAETLVAAVTTNDNTTLVWEAAGNVLVTNAVLTIGGPFDAGMFQIFDESSTIDPVFSYGAGDFLRPEWWGGLSSDISDDTDAFQDAINAAGSGVNTIRVSNGIYLVSPSSSSGILLKPGVSIIGTGGGSIIKLEDNSATDFHAIFLMATGTSGTGHHTMMFKDFVVDYNSDNQTAGWGGATNATGRYTFSFEGITDVTWTADLTFDNLTIREMNSRGSIRITPEEAQTFITKASVTNCTWEEVGRNNTTFRDHTTVLNSADNAIVVGNTFQISSTDFTVSPATAIELHGITGIASDNFISGYAAGIVASGQRRPTDEQTTSIQVHNNIIDDAYYGIFVTSNPWDIGAVVYGSQDVEISHNIYRGVIAQHTGVSGIGTKKEPRFIHCKITDDAKRVFINDNRATIVETGISYQNSDFVGMIDAGIAAATAGASIEDFYINRNYLENAIGPAIFVDHPTSGGATALLKKFEIRDNVIINAVDNDTLTVDGQQSVIIVATSDVESGMISGNHIVETRNPSQIENGILIREMVADTGIIHIVDNVFDVPNNTSWDPIFVDAIAGNDNIYIRQHFPLSDIAWAAEDGFGTGTGQYARVGSVYYDTESVSTLTKVYPSRGVDFYDDWMWKRADQAKRTSVDNSAIVLWQRTLTDETTYHIRAWVLAQRDDGSANASFGRSICVYRNGGGNATVASSDVPQVKSAGTFTCGAAATTVVTETEVTASSIITIQPTNVAAAQLMAGADSLYVTARVGGTSFSVSTAGGGNAAGTETFDYAVYDDMSDAALHADIKGTGAEEWDSYMNCNATEVRVVVQGETSEDVHWTAHVEWMETPGTL